MAAEIESAMLTFFQGREEIWASNITGVKVRALKEGSVIVDMTIASNDEILEVRSIESSVNDGIAKGKLAMIDASVGATIKVKGTS